jgi:catechol 2,3-dioxygenase-like lactoylglutathione lyase family enzyme
VFGSIHHIGFVVSALASAEQLFIDLGYLPLGDAVDDRYQRARLRFLHRRGADAAEPLVELIQPLDETASTYQFTQRNRFQIHHLCYVTADIDAAIVTARAARFTQVQPVVAAPAIGGSRITFFYARAVGLVEIVERPPFGPSSQDRPLA